ncbi:MAG: hypothetical protein F4Y02_01245 [Chloroflexi bacterium]|nr:hypothetical protein [Chloroflexota bacterium]
MSNETAVEASGASAERSSERKRGAGGFQQLQSRPAERGVRCDPDHKVIDGGFVRVMAWHDKERGFSNRMSDTAVALVAG